MNFLKKISFFTYIKMSKDSSAKYYQDNEERLQRKARERYQSLPKEEKKWQYNTKNIDRKINSKSWLNIETDLIKREKNAPIRNYFSFENLFFPDELEGFFFKYLSGLSEIHG